jgi:tetratricopeptide (TPR) repeat protein
MRRQVSGGGVQSLMQRLWLAVVVVSMACAHPAPPRQPNPDLQALARADAAVLEGCYDCLIQARDTYARVGVGPVRRLIVTRLFETELLIALREKELDLSSATASLARARDVARELPSEFEANRYLAIAEAVPDDTVGKSRAADRSFRIAHGGFQSRITEELAWLRAVDAGALRQPVREYLALSIDCSYPSRPRPPNQPAPPRGLQGAPPLTPESPALLVYRQGLCSTIDGVRMERARAASPRFVETSLFLGRVAVSNARNDGGGKARELLAEAYARFPNSPAVTYLTGNYNQIVGDCRAALRYYGETIALEALHEDALLGRTICLTYLKQTDEAMAAATHLIGLKLDNISDGYYWRAWNQEFMLKALPGARADIESAKAIRATVAIFTLAGVIEHDQDDLDPSETDLKIAVGMPEGSRQCMAWWYLGLVRMKRKVWIESAKSFETALGCYAQDEQDAADGLKFIKAKADLDETFRARQVANFEAAIVEAQHQKFAAAFNAANYFATGGDFPKAKTMVDIAAADTTLAEKVAILRDYLKDK